MKKAGLIFSLLLSINFVSAYSYGYGKFSLGFLFDALGQENLFLLGILIGSFALLNFALSKGMKDRTTSAVVSFIIALFITAGAYFKGFDISNFFYDIGISEEVLPLLIFLVVLGLFIYLGTKFGFRAVLLFAGGLLIALSMTDLVYEKGFIFVFGAILAGIGAWLYIRKGKENRGRRLRENRIIAADDY